MYKNFMGVLCIKVSVKCLLHYSMCVECQLCVLVPSCRLCVPAPSGWNVSYVLVPNVCKNVCVYMGKTLVSLHYSMHMIKHNMKY